MSVLLIPKVVAAMKRQIKFLNRNLETEETEDMEKEKGKQAAPSTNSLKL
jgi:hypothetical protein